MTEINENSLFPLEGEPTRKIPWNSDCCNPRLCVEIAVLRVVQPPARIPTDCDQFPVADYPNYHSNRRTGHVRALCQTE